MPEHTSSRDCPGMDWYWDSTLLDGETSPHCTTFSNSMPDVIASSVQERHHCNSNSKNATMDEDSGEDDVNELTLEEIFAHHDLEASSNTLESSMDTCTLDDSSDLSGVFDDCDQSCPDVDHMPQNRCFTGPTAFSRQTMTVSPTPPSSDQRFKPFHEEKWNYRVKELIQYKQQSGDCLVPHTYAPNPQLARWVKRQRRQYKLMQDGRQSTMTPERAQILDDLGFVWDSHDSAWSDKFKELLEYKQLHGHCQVPSSYRRNPQLATWIKCQRRQYKLYWEGRQSAMTPERIAALEKIGLKWEMRTSAKSTVGYGGCMRLSDSLATI